MTDSAEAYELGKMGSQYTNMDGDPASTTPNAPQETGCTSRLMIEPVLAGSMMAIFLAQTSLQNLYLKTACSVDLQYSHSICQQGVGEGFREAEIASQKLVSQINVSRGFVGAFISTVVLLFLGPWSDCSRRRKPLIIVSLLGMCISTINVMIIITFPIFSSIWVLYMVQIPMSVGGNFGLLLAAGFSYIGDVCHATGRNVTMAMGKHRAFIQVSSVLGSISGPLLYRYLGFYGVFPIVLFLQLSALLYAIFYIRDVQVNLENRVSVLDIHLPLEAARCLIRRRERHQRTVIFMMVVVALVERTIMAAEVVLLYMYVRNKFHWDDIWFGSYLAYRNIVSFVGTLIILRVFKSRMNLSDELVGVLSGLSLILAELFLMAARTTAVVFIVPVVAIIAQGSQVVQRPIVNKQIAPNEQGKIYSVVSALEQACQMAVSPTFSFLYSRTADVFPDAWLIPCAAIAAVLTSAFAVARTLAKKQAIAPDEPKEVHNASSGNGINDDQNREKENLIVSLNKEAESLIQHNVLGEIIGQEKEDKTFVDKEDKLQMLSAGTEIEASHLNEKRNYKAMDDLAHKPFNDLEEDVNAITESNLNLKLTLKEELERISSKVDDTLRRYKINS